MPSHTVLLANYAEEQEQQSCERAMLPVRSQTEPNNVQRGATAAAERETKLLLLVCNFQSNLMAEFYSSDQLLAERDRMWSNDRCLNRVCEH